MASCRMFTEERIPLKVNAWRKRSKEIAMCFACKKIGNYTKNYRYVAISASEVGVGMFGKDHVRLKKKRCKVAGLPWRALKKREYDTKSLAVLIIDEYLTSKVCNHCKHDNMAGVKGVGVLQYKNCKIIWI
ncbi:hypothetical protein K501DRAFT_270327 [Backusella circina FSU 941]|nr:hypothetical protein K501DRAFT_270327 [Backusella circina FSU 941]